MPAIDFTTSLIPFLSEIKALNVQAVLREGSAGLQRHDLLADLRDEQGNCPPSSININPLKPYGVV